MHRFSPIILVAILGMIVACNREETIYPDPYLSDSYNMICKFLDPLKGEDPAENQTCVDWEYDGDSTFTMTHFNSGFNCCPVAILTSMRMSGDTLYIAERDSMQLCRCNCLYDIDFVVHYLKPQKYVVRFIEPFVIDPMPPLVFEINLEEEMSGRVCQNRDYYPWRE